MGQRNSGSRVSYCNIKQGLLISGSGRDVGGHCRRTLLLEVLILGIECVMRAEIQCLQFELRT
jgi:hypothetical protein